MAVGVEVGAAVGVGAGPLTATVFVAAVPTLPEVSIAATA